jgi:hypothetical protein
VSEAGGGERGGKEILTRNALRDCNSKNCKKSFNESSMRGQTTSGQFACRGCCVLVWCE